MKTVTEIRRSSAHDTFIAESVYLIYIYPSTHCCDRAQELCESRGGRPGLPVPNSPFGFCGRLKATLQQLCLISVTVFNFTHPPVLSAPLLILSASRFLAPDSPDSPLLVSTPFLFSVHLHGMTFPFLFDRNPLWTHSDLI